MLIVVVSQDIWGEKSAFLLWIKSWTVSLIVRNNVRQYPTCVLETAFCWLRLMGDKMHMLKVNFSKSICLLDSFGITYNKYYWEVSKYYWEIVFYSQWATRFIILTPFLNTRQLYKQSQSEAAVFCLFCQLSYGDLEFSTINKRLVARRPMLSKC